MARLPLTGVTACTMQIGLHGAPITGDPYVRAVASTANGVPLRLASQAQLLAAVDILDGLDGIPFTGSPSTVEPFHYSGPACARGTAQDPARDAKPHDLATFQAFGDACRKRAIQRDADASTSA